MTIWNKTRFRVVRKKNSLLEMHHKAWNGLSILVFRDDSALTPKKHRINYYVLVFFGLLLFSPPLVSVSLQIEKKFNRTDPAEILKKRMVLLNTLKILTDEKRELFGSIDEQMVEFQNVSDSSRRQLIGQYALRQAAILDRERRITNPAITQGLVEMKNLHSRATVFQETAFYSLNMLWYRLTVHHIMPRHRPLPQGYGHITSQYGRRDNPFAIDVGETGEFHSGTDFASSGGDPIIATGPGEVIQAVTKVTEGYGKFVRIHHGLGYTSLYAHCSEILVTQGQKVKRGQAIALVGRTGRATGSHVHYEIRMGAGRHVNPMPYIQLK